MWVALACPRPQPMAASSWLPGSQKAKALQDLLASGMLLLWASPRMHLLLLQEEAFLGCVACNYCQTILRTAVSLQEVHQTVGATFACENVLFVVHRNCIQMRLQQSVNSMLKQAYRGGSYCCWAAGQQCTAILECDLHWCAGYHSQ